MCLLDAICQGLPPFISICIIHWLCNIPFMSDLWPCFLPLHFESPDSYLRSTPTPSEQHCKTKTNCCSNCSVKLQEFNFWSWLLISFKEQLRTVSYQQGAACEVLVPLSIWDVQRLNTVCSEQLLSKYEDVIDTRSNIGHSEETGLFALFFSSMYLFIYLVQPWILYIHKQF